MGQLNTIKIHANQSGIKVSEISLLVKLNQVKHHLSHLRKIEFLSPYCISNGGLTSQVADFFISNCPSLELYEMLQVGLAQKSPGLVLHARHREMDLERLGLIRLR